MAHLTVGQRLHGVVTHVEFDSTGCYSYIQFCEVEVPDLLAEAIDSSVHAGDLTTPDCRTGDFVLALFSDDGAWYRAEVRDISGGACTVFFVDYGNTEVVSLDNIKIMPPSVGQKPPLASRCRILGNWGNENDQSIKDRLVNEEFMIEIISHSNGIFDVQLNDGSGAQSLNKGSANNVLETLNLKTGSKHLAYISFIDSPNKFWIQLVEHENSLNGLMEDITSHVQSGPEYLKTPSIGSYCLSTFSEDEATYRSVVLTSTSGKCLVQFVDYGNSESKSASELMVLPDRFKVLPIQGLKCCYKSTKIKPNMLEDKLQELTSSSVTLTIVSKSSDSYTVEIDEVENMSAPSQNGSISVGEVKHDYPISELELNSVYDVCLSYVCHPGKFYVQLIDNAATIDEMMDLVAEEYITSKLVHHPQRGLSCLAKLSDGQFYRCMIKELKGDQVIICAVDFGFEECVQMSSLKEISTNNQSLTVQCFECTVDITKLAEGFWSGKEVKILKELESQVPLVAKVTTVRGSVYQLDLYDTRIEDIDRYINAELLGVSKTIKSPVSSSQKSVVRQSCKVPPPDVREGSEEMVCVTAVKSKNEFYGQLTKVPINKFADLQELLSETYEVPQESIVDAQIGTFCCAKYDDGGWYRAVITGINGNLAETGFTDFGDSCTQPITSLKQLLPTIASTPQLCILCQLTNIPQRFQAEEINSLLMNKVIELKLVSKLDGVYPSFRVELTNHRNNHDINSKLSGTQAPRLPRLPNVASKMQSKGFGDSTRSSGNDTMQISIGSEEDIMVTHVIDPEHFHCQLNRMASPLDEVMDKLHTSCSALGETDEVLEDVALGQSCAAKYSDDQVWYRAQITGLLAKGLVEVLFFDYGNTECVSRETLKKLKPEFLSLPPQAVYCGMSGLSAAQGFWSPEHIAQFEDLVLDQTFKAKFKSFSSGDDLYLVELTNAKGENVNQKFGESTHSLCQSNRSVSYGSGNGMDMKVNVRGTAEWSATGGRDRNYNRKPSGDSGFGARERSDRFSGGNRFGSNQRSEDGGSWGDNRNESRGFGKQSSFGGGSGRFGNRDSNSQGGGDDWGDGDSKGFGKQSSFGGGFNRQDRNAGSGRFGNRDNSGGGSDDWGDGESKGFGNKSSFGGGFNKQDRNVGSGRFGNRDGDSGGFGNRDGGFGNRGGGSRGFGNRDDGGSGGFNRRDNDSDRGSGGGFGSRSGGGRGCHKCGEEGHFARECPNSDSSSRGGGRGCHKCGEEGHFARECPNAESRGRGRGCHKCGEEGHFARDCPNSAGLGFGRKSEGFGGRSGGGFGGKSEGFGAKSGGFGGGRSSGGFGSSASNASGNTEDDWGGGGQSGGFGGGSGFGGRKSQDSGFGGKREGQFRGGDSRGFGGGRKPEGGFGGKSRDGDNWNTDSSSGGFSGGGRSQGGFGSSQRQKGGFGGSGSSGFGGSSQPAPAEDDWGSEVDTVNVPSQSAPAADDAWQHDGADSFTLAKLKVGDCLDIFVVYSISPGQFWCQVANTSEKLGAMMDKMNEEYNGLSSTDLTIESPEIGMPCVAMFSEDELWYRAEIVGFSDNDQYEVQFVDYGNTEMVTKSKIKTVKPQYLSLPSQGVRCSLHGVQPNDSVWTEDATKQFESLTTDKTLTAKVKNYAAGLYLVDLEDSEGKINVGQRLSEEGLCVLQQDGTGDRHTVVPNPYPDREYQEDQKFEGYVSWIDNPASFWVQPSDKVDHIEEFGSKLQEQYSNNVSSVEQVSVGMAVVALYSEDGAWYRAYVERVVKDKYTVRFVDYGNSDTVELVHIRLPSPDLLKEQCQAVHCGLTGIQPLQTDSWNVDAKDIMDSLVKDAVSVHLLQKSGEVWQTTVEAGDVNIADELIGAAVVKKEAPKSETESTTESAHYKSVPDITVGTSVSVFVSHINSLNSFYCQLSKNSDDLDQVMGKIEEYCSSQTKIACSLRNDMPCLAKFSGDEMWYRAKILQVHDGAAEVLFIDYGNSEKVPDSNIFEITNEFLNLNPQAIHCTLSNVASPGSAALSQFQNAVLDKELTMTITSVKDDILTVTLHDSGMNVEDHLTPESADQKAGNISMLDISVGQSVVVYTSFIESPSQFYLQLAQSEEKLTEISTKLEETYANCSPSEMTLSTVSVGQICCAKYSEDGVWYRAKIESTNNDRAVVRFVDYGNSDEVDAATLKVLLPELAVWKAQAVECKLSGISAKDGDWSDSAIEQFENSTMNQKLTCVFISSCEVSLVGEEGDVGEGLVNSGCAVKAESKPAECAVPSAEIPIGQAITVFTSVVESPAEFFVQMSGVEDKLAELSEKLEEKFSGGSSTVITSPSIGQHCCTQYSEDGAWYRSMIENIEGDKANVRFIDYGNSEDVSLSALMVLPEEFCKEGPLAYKCKIASIEPVNKSWTDEAKEYFKSQTADQELTCTFTSSCCVQLSNADGDIGQSLVSLGHATEPTESTDRSDQVLHFEEQIAPSEEIKMFVSSFEDGTLYLQSEREEALLGELIELLQTSCPSGRTLTDISVGSHCCSLFPADSSWYRAVVTKVIDEEVEVFFVDFGNSSTVSRDNLRRLTPKMLSPPLAYKCCLSEMTNMTQHESVALKSLTADQPLKVTFVGKSDDTHLVKLLLDDGGDVLQKVKKASKSGVKEEVSEDPKTVLSDSMIDTDLRDDIASKSLEMDETHLTLDMTGYSEAPLDESSLQDKETTAAAAAATEEQVPLEFISNISLLKSLTLSEDDRIQVTVCHVTSPSAFFVQLNDNKSSLDTLLDEMFELYSNTDDDKYAVKVPTIGMVCAAKYSQDAAWYRGKIKKVVDDDKLEVQFLDHGNTDTCQKCDLRKLITKFAELPLQAVPCTLGGVRATEGPWSEEAVQLFSETTLDKNMLADVVRSVGDGSYLIQLLDMGISVSDTLIQKGFGVDATTPVVVSKKTKRVFSDSSDVAITPRIVRKLTEETQSIQEQEEEKDDCSLGRFKRLGLEINAKYSVTISHTESPSLFWCQLNDNASDLDKMMDEIQEVYKEETTLADLGSECCIVKHSDDGLYYRAFVDYDPDTIWALLVDYGIFKEVTQVELKPIKEEFLALPAQAFLCGFSDIRPLGIGHSNWDESAVCAFEELTSEAELTIVIERVKKNVKSYVQLLDGDVSIGQELVKDGYAVLRSDEDDSLLMDANLTLDSSLDDSRLLKIDKVLYAMNLSSRFNPYKMIQLESDSEHCVELTEMITPTLFYMHLCEDDQMDKIRADITKQIEELPDSKLAREEATEGVVCLAWSESSRMFERAKVLSVADTKVEVFFVDTGRSDSVPLDKCHHLPEALKSIPAQAVPCGLTDIESEDEKGWTTEASLFVRDYLSNTPLLHMYVHRVGKQGLHFITIGCESEDLNRLMVDLGFARAQTDSTLYRQVHEPPSELEQSFDELSMNRQNSYGSSLDHGGDLGDVSALDTTGHSVCNCNFSIGLEDSSLDVSARTEDTTASLADESALETTDLSACQGDESVLDTTSASDSFHFVNLKNKTQNNDKKGEITEQPSSSKVVCEESSKDESVLEESKADESILDESTEEEKLQQEVQEELKEDDPKQEEPKEDDFKQEEPQEDNSKMEEPQGDNSKQEEVKEEDSKMEETKEDDSKQKEVKEDNSKMEETKEDDSKQEERKEDDSKQEDEPKQVESKEDVFFDAEEEDAECKSSTLEDEGEKVEIKKSESDLYVNAAEFIDPNKDSVTVDSSNVESNNNASGSTKSETEDLSPKVTQTGDSIGNDPTESSKGEVVDAVINESGDKPEKSHDEEIVLKSDPKEVSAEEGGNANDEANDSNDTKKEMQVDTESNAHGNDTAKVQTDEEDNMSRDTTETTSDAQVISECDTAGSTEKDGGSQESTNENPEKAGEEGEKKSYADDKEETPADD